MTTNPNILKNFSIRAWHHELVMKEKEAGKLDTWRSKMIKANIPREFWGINLQNFGGDKKAKALVEKYCENIDEALEKGIGFCFMGPHGIGKTSLLMVILKTALQHGYSAFYMTLPEIFRQIYLGFEYKELLVELNQILLRTQFLAIGELGRDYHRKESQQFALSEFDSLVRQRRSMCFATSFDTNMEKEELEGTYGEALMSLFASSLKLVQVSGKDFRKTVQKKVVEDFFTEGEE